MLEEGIILKLETAVFEAAAGTSAQLLPSDLPEIAFSGKSNVGKSSLINRLLNRKSLARTSATPGKTITVNFYKLDTARFVDLPGYGYAKVARSEKLRWADLVEGYFNSERDLRLVVQLVDMRHPPSREDLDMIDYLGQMQLPFLIVLTKSDKLNKTQRTERLNKIEEELEGLPHPAPITFSAQNGEGAAEVLAAIRAALNEL